MKRTLSSVNFFDAWAQTAQDCVCESSINSDQVSSVLNSLSKEPLDFNQSISAQQQSNSVNGNSSINTAAPAWSIESPKTISSRQEVLFQPPSTNTNYSDGGAGNSTQNEDDDDFDWGAPPPVAKPKESQPMSGYLNNRFGNSGDNSKAAFAASPSISSLKQTRESLNENSDNYGKAAFAASPASSALKKTQESPNDNDWDFSIGASKTVTPCPSSQPEMPLETDFDFDDWTAPPS